MQENLTKPAPRSYTPRKKPRTPEPSTVAQDERQVRCFEFHLQGLPIRTIAAQVGCDRDTAALDIRMEGQRRANERAWDRQNDLASSLGRYEQIISRAMVRSEVAKNHAIEEKKNADGTITRKVRSVLALEASNHAEELIRKTQANIDEAVGLKHVPEVIVPLANATNVYALIIQNLPPEIREKTVQNVLEHAKEHDALPAHPR